MRATVKEFRPEAGFGTLKLEDGSEVTFDVAASNKRDVHVGDVGDVTIGTGLRGAPKVTLVLFALESQRTVVLTSVFEYAQTNGLLLDWTIEDARAAAGELGLAADVDTAGAVALLQHYLGRGLTERARRERAIVLDWRDDRHIVGDVATISNVADVRTLLPIDAEGVPKGLESIDMTGTLQPLMAWFDDVLGQRGRPERWVPLPARSEVELFVLRDPRTIKQTSWGNPLLRG